MEKLSWVEIEIARLLMVIALQMLQEMKSAATEVVLVQEEPEEELLFA